MNSQRVFICAATLAVLVASGASAQPMSFKGKSITMLVGFAAGGGTDLAGRIIASVLGRYLPGEPTIVVQNVPGAEGLTALNHFAQVKPDGLTLTMGSGSQADPTQYRKPQSHYDPTQFMFIGGAGRGGSALVINQEAERRLLAPDAAPVIMGSTSGAPRTDMQMAAWGRAFLNWNLKWVLGYRGTNELFVALDRGEIEMTSTSNTALFSRMLTSGKAKILVQSGTMRDGVFSARPDFGSAPLIPALLKGRIADPVATRAFDYWLTVHSGPDKWLALPPGTPAAIADLYRQAFARLMSDPEFVERSRKLADDLTLMAYRDVDLWMQSLGRTTPDALEFIAAMLRAQGVKID
jgi:putative tricarboxylic transport membrane protein